MSTQIKYGKGIPNNSIEKEYSIYIDTVTNTMYRRNGDLWIQVRKPNL